jgi:MFS family permease/uncharacterized protein (DUF1015 family)
MTRTLDRESRPPARHRGQEPPTEAPGRNLALLWAGQFVNTAGLMMLVPVMPFYLEQLGTSGTSETQTWAGVAIAAPALALTVATPLWGRLGDRVGRKWMVVRALLGLAAAMVIMAVATTPLMLVAGRLLQGTLGGVVEAAAAFAGATGSGKKRGSSLGKSFSATAAGALAGPIAGGLFVGTGGLRQLMLVIAAAAAVLGVGCAAGLREPGRGQPRGERRARSSAPEDRRPSVLRVPSAVPLALAAVGAYFGVYGLIPVFAEQVRGTVAAPDTASVWVGVLHSVMWAASLVGSFWWGKHNDTTHRPLRTFTIAAGGCAASIAALSLPLGPVALIPVRLVQGFCFAALAQSLFLHFSWHAPAEHRSSFVGMANSFLLAGQSAGPLLAGPMVAVMPVAVAITVMATMCALACAVTVRPARAEKHSAGGHECEAASHEQAVPALASDWDTIRIPRTTATARPAGTDVAAFRAWRIAPEHLHRLATRYATPWDQQNGKEPPSSSAAASVLRAWKRHGVVVRDRQPAFYAYEQSGPRGSQRGLVAAVHLNSRLLPHEEVIPARVNDMTELLRVGHMNLNPILLGYSGDGRTTHRLSEAIRRPPVTEVLADDGQLHRVWHLPGHETHSDIIDELSTRAAFIADGHHRHAAARQFRRDRYATGHGSGPWDYLCCLLVDVTQHPLRLAPIHRVLPFADPRTALREAATQFRVQPLDGELSEWLRVLTQQARHAPAFVVATPRRAFLLTNPEPQFLASTLRRTPASLRTMHVTVLHRALIRTLWSTPDSSTHIRYDPSATNAVRQVRAKGGIAVLVSPPSHKEIKTSAVAGTRLPHKSTSFGPTPHPGLILRALDKD